MSYHGLGSVSVPTSPPTPSSSVYHEPGFKYLFVDEAKNPRPEYAAIIASASVPGFGWTESKMATGTVFIKEQVPFGKYNMSPTSPPWPGSGITVYGAPFLGSPDGFFTLVQPKDLMKWANQPGLWIVKLPGNLPFTKESWDKMLGRTSTVAPQPPPPFVVPAECPAGTVDVGGGVCKPLGTPGSGGSTTFPIPGPGQPPVEKPWSFSEFYDGLSRDRKNFLLGGAIGIVVATAWWVKKTYYPSRGRVYEGKFESGPVVVKDPEYADYEVTRGPRLLSPNRRRLGHDVRRGKMVSMANSLGIVEGDNPGALLPEIPALPGIPGVPTSPVSVPIGPGSTTQLPSTPDGNVVAPVPAAPPPATAPPPAPLAPPSLLTPPSFWERHGDTITTGFAVVGVIAVASMILKVRS